MAKSYLPVAFVLVLVLVLVNSKGQTSFAEAREGQAARLPSGAVCFGSVGAVAYVLRM